MPKPSNHQQQQPCHRRQWKNHHEPSKHHGIAYINATSSNTFITVTDSRGDEKTGSSSGCLKGFKGSRRSTKYAAHATAEHVARAAILPKIESVEVRIKGIGLSRKNCSPKGSREGGLIITEIRDVIPMPHNGCRPPKKRRVQRLQQKSLYSPLLLDHTMFNSKILIAFTGVGRSIWFGPRKA